MRTLNIMASLIQMGLGIAVAIAGLAVIISVATA